MQLLTLLNRQRSLRLKTRWLREAADLSLPECLAHSDDEKFALRQLPEITVAIVSDRVMAKIHVDFMGIEGPTDVITFDHGEIVVSAETAQAYANEYNHPVEWELALYTIHGLLHLNGFDDLTTAPAARMRRTQTRIWRRVIAQLPPV